VELRQLRYLQEVARTGSITEAASRLGVTQPALTVALRKLERSVRSTLLSRDRRGARLTSTGHELLRSADEALSLLEEARERIAGLETGEVGRFTIGCPESLGAYFLPRFIARFHHDAPGIDLSLWNGPSRRVEAAVLAREVDFGLTTHALAHPDLVRVALFNDAFDLMVRTQGAPHGFANAVARLRAGPLVYVGHVPQSTEIIDRLAQKGMVPARRLACGDLELVKSIALAGVGVALLPRRVADYGHHGRLQRLHPRLPYVPDTIHLIYRGDLHRTRAALRLKDALTAHAEQFAFDPLTNRTR
jgi:DNA-binding transcriptional LysR family regulator